MVNQSIDGFEYETQSINLVCICLFVVAVCWSFGWGRGSIVVLVWFCFAEFHQLLKYLVVEQ